MPEIGTEEIFDRLGGRSIGGVQGNAQRGRIRATTAG
jgi:hypothetical protein